jgi:hypothetical protein
MIGDRKVIYPYLFAFSFSNSVIIAFQHALVSNIKKKIALVGHACSRPLITIKFHDFHASDIIRVVGEIISYHERD